MHVKLVTFGPNNKKTNYTIGNEKFAYYFFIHKKLSKASRWILFTESPFGIVFIDFVGNAYSISHLNIWATG